MTFASKNSKILNENEGKQVPRWPADHLQREHSAGGAPRMRHCTKLGILVVLVLRVGMAALAARSVCVSTTSQHEDVV